MLVSAENRSNITQKTVLTIYSIIDKSVSLLIKLTFPLWALPVLTVLFLWKIINLWKHILWFIISLIYPNLPPLLAYAILKGNGQYLRQQHESVLFQQFYDYTSRKFMSIAELQPESKIVELECDNYVGVKYLSQCVKSGKVRGIMSNHKLIRDRSWPQESLKQTNYKITGQCEQIDCFLLFNFKSKINYLKHPKVDLIQILNYCRHHLSKDGYVVYGDYFQQGEAANLSAFFEVYNFKIVDQEDITKNIDYAKRLLSKDRHHCEVKIVQYVKKMMTKCLDLRSYEVGKSFVVLILENKA